MKGLAERVGFEPTVEFPLHTLSKRAPSTTRTSLRVFGISPQYSRRGGRCPRRNADSALKFGGVSARVSGLRRCLRKDGQQETGRIADLERAALPLRVARLRLERDAGVLGPLGDLVDVTRRRRNGQPHADSLLAVAPL